MSTKTLAEIVSSVIADGKVDQNEVVEIKEAIYEDGKVSREEIDVLFQINDAVSDSENCPEWSNFFATAIADHFCEDGKIDEEEANYLTEKLMNDGGVDEIEKSALRKIRERATDIFPAFDNAMKSLGI